MPCPRFPFRPDRGAGVALAGLLALLMTACGGGRPAIDALPQTLSVAAPEALAVGAQAALSGSSSSGLALRYESLTPAVCAIGGDSGLLSGLAAGACQVLARQDGDDHWAPVRQTVSLTVTGGAGQTLVFDPAPAMVVHGLATVTARSSAGLLPRYASLTPAACAVEADSGRVQALAAGTCRIEASQPGDADHAAAAPVQLALEVSAPTAAPGLPGAPLAVRARLGDDDDTLVIEVDRLDDAGAQAISGFTARSMPAGLSVQAATPTLSLRCPSGCAGYAIEVVARNASGEGPPSSAVSVLTDFDVVARFFEPDTQPNDTLFLGRFRLDSTQGTVTGLVGTLSESMTGSATLAMSTVALNHPREARLDADGVWRVSSFALDSSDVFAPGGFSDTATGLYAGYPAPYDAARANSFVTVVIDPRRPRRALGRTELDRLAYGDCAPGGMMGAACMTGQAGGGTMGGWPAAQTVTRRAR